MEEQNIILEKQKSPNLKIIIAAVAIIIILAVVLFVVFSSPIPKDYKKLRQNLRDADYEVESITDREDAMDYFAELLDNLLYYEDDGLYEEAERIVEEIIDLNKDTSEELVKSVDCSVVAVDEDLENFIMVIYFDDSKSAKEFYKIFEVALEFVKDNGSDGNIFEEVKRDDFKFAQKGKVMYIGTKDALKACK